MRAFRAFDQFGLRSFGAEPQLLKVPHNAFYTHAGRGAAPYGPGRRASSDAGFDPSFSRLEVDSADNPGYDKQVAVDGCGLAMSSIPSVRNHPYHPSQ